ncbi:MAG: DNA polymerase III subunit delta [Gemmatimonadetes bacterium]|nr:DNA polymerase III subunit delta [Gemmatimonadota bacterium]
MHGAASRLRDEAARRLAGAALSPSLRDFNFDQVEGKRLTDEQLGTILAMPPMMADLRVLLLRDAQHLKPRGRKRLLDAMRSPPPQLLLIVTLQVPAGSRAAYYRDLKSAAGPRAIEWSQPRENDVPGWLLERARLRWEIDLPRDLAPKIANAVGSDPSRLDAELEKISLLAGEDRTEEKILSMMPRSRGLDRWRWMDLVAGRKFAAALKHLEGVLVSERGTSLVSGLTDHFLFLGIALGGQQEVRRSLSELGRHYLGWKAPAYARQARAWSEPELEHAVGALYRADRLLKSGGRDQPVLEEMLLSMAQARLQAA